MTASGPGHVFVTRGRLETFAGDAVVVPTDSAFWVEKHFWQAVGELPQGGVKALRPPTWPLGGAGRAADGRRVWFVDVGGRTTSQICRALADVVADIARADLEPLGGRSRPLVLTPLLGIGAGGSKPGEVISGLLGALTSATSVDGAPDVAVVVLDASAYAAAQHVRRSVDRWPLSPERVALAQRTGARAHAGELALLVGAGVSVPAGLPDWTALIAEAEATLGRAATPVPSDMHLLDRAELVGRIDRHLLPGMIQDRFATHRHSLGHALLNDLQCRHNVTTNFDPCFENASAVHGGLALLTRDRPLPGQRWLLKMHGTHDDRGASS